MADFVETARGGIREWAGLNPHCKGAKKEQAA